MASANDAVRNRGRSLQPVGLGSLHRPLSTLRSSIFSRIRLNDLTPIFQKKGVPWRTT